MSRILKNYSNKVSQKYKKGIHEGIDIIGDNKRNDYTGYLDFVIAHSDGEVIEVRKNYKTTDQYGNSYGNYVLLKHQNGMFTLYAHLKYGSVQVSKHDMIKKGDILGYMGATGRASGAHVHFEVRNEQNRRIDPTKYINDDLPNKKDQNYLFQIGEQVIINGNLYISSNASHPSGKIKNKVTFITRISKNSLHPYNTTGDLGWMDESDIKKYSEDMIHEVKKGDTISELSMKYYGKYTKELGMKIINANLKDYPSITLNYIVVGWKLLIPK